jgi:hypothetical protein
VLDLNASRKTCPLRLAVLKQASREAASLEAYYIGIFLINLIYKLISQLAENQVM